jgi:hypothetical protein
VLQARERQLGRFKGSDTIANARMSQARFRKHCALEPALGDLLQQAMEKLSLSARAHHRILKVARTTAGFVGAEDELAGNNAERQCRSPQILLVPMDIDSLIGFERKSRPCQGGSGPSHCLR